MTNIAGWPDNNDLWIEVIDHIDPSGGGGGDGDHSPIHDFIQLYR
jgi:hypothetical protein